MKPPAFINQLFFLFSFLYLTVLSSTLNAQNFRSSTSGGIGSGTLLTINKPAGTIRGDVMIAAISARTNTETITAPSGWALIRQIKSLATGVSSMQQTYWKVAGASEPINYSWTISIGHSGAAGGVSTFYNINTANPINIENGIATALELNHSTPDIATTLANTMIITTHSFASSSIWAAPPGMIKSFDQSSSGSTNNSAGVSIAMSYLPKPSAGQTNPQTATATNYADPGTAQIIALVSSTISYPGSPYCSKSGIGSVIRTVTTAGGTYSSSGTGLIIDAASGDINIGASSAGTHRITYTFGGGDTTNASVRINKIGNNQIDYTNGTQVISSVVDEGSPATLTAPAGNIFVKVNFASYGLPTGSSPTFALGQCHALTSQGVAESYLLGNNTASIPANNGNFLDPCSGTFKKLCLLATYAHPICSGTSPGIITGTTPTGGNGSYTYLWEQSSTSSSTGYATVAGVNNAKDYTPGILTQPTWFRRTVTSGACTDAILIQVSVNPLPTTSTAGADQTTCGPVTVTLAANLPSVGIGTWSIASGTGGTVTSPTSPTSTFSGIAGTIYSLRWTISNSPCIASTDDVVITLGTIPSVSCITTETCVGGSTGTITATGSGGSTPYTYNLNGGIYQGSNLFTSLVPGSYTIGIKSNAGCIASSSVTVSPYGTSTDNQGATGNDSWIAHMYDGSAFSNYIGQFKETETFNELFGGSAVCFPITSNNIARSIYTESFSVKLKMVSTKRGLYAVDLGSDDGSRLTVDGTMAYNNWTDQGYTDKKNVLIKLSGASSLLYEFYEQGGDNQVVFQNLTLILANTLNAANLTQTICSGTSGLILSGDNYGVLPAGITLSGTGYQWSYSTTPGGARTIITGATGATYLPSAIAAPFNTPNTYYIYRNALLTSANNINPNPYIATNESNAATLIIAPIPSATISYTGSPYCSSAGTALVTRAGTASGSYSSAASLSINSATGGINLAASTAGTYTVTYSVAAAGGCPAYTTGATLIIASPGTWSGAVSSDWNAGSNWVCGAIPIFSTSITIPGGSTNYPILNTGAGSVKNITIGVGASFTVAGATLKIAGVISNAGTFNVSTGTVEMNGTSAQTIPVNAFAGNLLKNLTINNTAGVTLTGAMTLTDVLTVTTGNLASNGMLTLKSTAAGTARVAALPAASTITGNVTIERYISSRRAWRLLSAPLSLTGAPTINQSWQEGVTSGNPLLGYGTQIVGGTAGNGFDQGLNSNPSLKVYNNSTNTFTGLPPIPGTNTSITSHQGYFLFIRGDRSTNLLQGANAAVTPTTLRMKGQIRTGDIPVPVNALNMTLVGNPYPSPIDFHSLIKSNVNDKLYVWDATLAGTNGLGGYVTMVWNTVTGVYDGAPSESQSNRLIPSGSAFFVESTDRINPGIITFKESHKSTSGNELVFRPVSLGEKQRVNLFAVNTDGSAYLTDGVLTTYDGNNADTVDNNDALKLYNIAENICISRDGKMLSIERRQTIEGSDTTFLKLYTLKQREYKLQISTEAMGNSGLFAAVKDNYSAGRNNTPVNMGGITEVFFTVNSDLASYAPDRFSIVFGKQVVLPVTFTSVKAYAQQKDILVSWNTANELNIKEYVVEISATGVDFTKAQTVPVKTNNGGDATYKWLDANAAKGLHYYRIKSIELSGKENYSSIVKATMDKSSGGISVYPNPVTGRVIGLQLNNMAAGNYKFRLINPLGQALLIKEIDHPGGNARQKITGNKDFAKGVYSLEITNQFNTASTIRLIIE